MTCLCGDLNCPSCGPLLGGDQAKETVIEWILEDVLADFPPGIDTLWLSEELATRLGHANRSQKLADAVYEEAQTWLQKMMMGVQHEHQA